MTVTAASAMQADGLSTALLVLGPVHGRALVEAAPGVGAMIVAKDGVVVRSDGFDLLGA